MYIEQTGWADDRRGGGHMTAALIAGVVSLLFHIVGIFCISNVEFGVVNLSGDAASTTSEKILTVDTVSGQVDAGEDRPDVWEKGDSSYGVDVSKEMAALGLASDETLTEPPVIKEKKFMQDASNIVKPGAVPERRKWNPKREILVVEDRVAVAERDLLKRKKIPLVERVSDLSDLIAPVDMEKVSYDAVSSLPVYDDPRPNVSKLSEKALAELSEPDTAQPLSETPEESLQEIFEEKASEITDIRPVEDMLVASLTKYKVKKNSEYGYFRMDIKRAGANILPVIPKDVILVQDSSASVTEQRLYFCREGMTLCLDEIGDKDRFNVISFSDRPRMCFTDWVKKDDASIKKAKGFISGMQSGGNTDIFASIRDLVKINRKPGRPVVVLLVTDGFSNTGQTKSSNIVGDFSNLNNGEISVFTMGTIDTANSYLLDLLSYCNGGDAFVVTKGRWDIPASIQARMKEISRPVLSNLKFRFAEDSGCDVYPVMTGHLYLDRSMVLYGRYKIGAEKVVFQSIGKAGASQCDMIFDLPLDDASESSDKEIMRNWARQKIYHLIGEYTRDPDLDTLKEIKRTAHNYKVKIPYDGKY